MITTITIANCSSSCCRTSNNNNNNNLNNNKYEQNKKEKQKITPKYHNRNAVTLTCYRELPLFPPYISILNTHTLKTYINETKFVQPFWSVQN